MSEKAKKSDAGGGSLFVQKARHLRKKLSSRFDPAPKPVGTASSTQQRNQALTPAENEVSASSSAADTKISDGADSAPPRLSLLWHSAYKRLKETEQDLMKQYENEAAEVAGIKAMPSNDDEFLLQMNKIVKIRQEQIEDGKWKEQFSGHQLAIKDFVEPVIGIVQWSKDYVGKVIETASSPPASLAWAGVCLVLPPGRAPETTQLQEVWRKSDPLQEACSAGSAMILGLVLNPYDQEATRTTALLRIAELIKQCTLREESYGIYADIRKESEVPDTGVSDGMYRAAIEDLYLEILKFEARVVHFFAGRSFKRGFQEMIKWNDWKGWFDDITSKETALKEIEEQYNQVNVEKRWRQDWDRTMTHHEDMMGGLDLMTKAITQISTDRNTARLDKERNKFIEWLNPLERYASNEESDKKRTMARPQPNAYNSEFSKWLIERLGSWKDTQNSFLWLCGKAGYGKSKLSSDVVQHLERTFRDDALTGIAFFFISFKIKATFDLTNIIQSMIAQLLSYRPDMPKELEPLQTHYRGGSALTLEQLKEALHAVIYGFARSYIIIDGLDECPNPEDAGTFENGIAGRPREELLDLLREIRDWSLNGVHLYVASRRNDDIKDVLLRFVEQPGCALVDLQEPENQSYLKEDISRYLNQEFQNHVPMLAGSGDADLEIKKAAKKTLLDKSDGMFLYAYLQMSMIKRRPVSKGSVKRVLKNLPKDLDDTFDQMFLRIDKTHREQAVRVLTWIAVAPFRIRVERFTEASMVKFRPVDDINAKENALDCSMPLIEESGVLFEPTSADDIVALLPSLLVLEGPYKYLALVHSSLLDYLLSREIRAAHKDAAVRQFALDLTEAHWQVADAAFRLYVRAKETASAPDYSDLEEDYCMSMAMVLHQAARLAELMKLPNWPACWHQLVTRAFFDAGKNPDLLPQFIKPFLGPYVESKVESGVEPEYRPWQFDRMVPLEFLIQGEYFELLEFFVQGKLVSIQDMIPAHSASDGNYTALSYAGRIGVSAKMFNYLISQGCDIFCPIGKYPDLFGFLANDCSAYSFMHLLEAPEALRKFQDRDYSPLLATITREFPRAKPSYDSDGGLHIIAVASLVPDCFTTFDRITMPALQTAIALKNLLFMDILIQQGADIHGKGQFFGNALQCAVALMRSFAIFILLNEGARMGPKGPEWDAMILAIEEGTYFEDGEKAGQLAVERLKLAQAVFGDGDHSEDYQSCSNKFRNEVDRLGLSFGDVRIRWEYLRAYEGQPMPSSYRRSDRESAAGSKVEECGSLEVEDRDVPDTED